MGEMTERDMLDQWLFNVELECSGASLSPIEEIVIGGAVLKMADLLTVLKYAANLTGAPALHRERRPEQPLCQAVPDRIYLLDLGDGDISWCDDPSPDGETSVAVEYVRNGIWRRSVDDE